MCAIAYFKPKSLLITGKTQRSGKGTGQAVDKAFWSYLPLHSDSELKEIMEKEDERKDRDQKLFRSQLKRDFPDSQAWRVNWTKVKNIVLLFQEFGTSNGKKIISQVLSKPKPSSMNISELESAAQGRFAIHEKNLVKFIKALPTIRERIPRVKLACLNLANQEEHHQAVKQAVSLMMAKPGSDAP